MNRCITTSTSLYFLSFPINTRKNITFYQLFYAISHNHSSSFFFDNSFFKKKGQPAFKYFLHTPTLFIPPC